MILFLGMEITLCSIPIIITHINNYVHHGNGNFSSITMEFPRMVSSKHGWREIHEINGGFVKSIHSDVNYWA